MLTEVLGLDSESCPMKNMAYKRLSALQDREMKMRVLYRAILRRREGLCDNANMKCK